jgi:carboxyl-terminal processing protease
MRKAIVSLLVVLSLGVSGVPARAGNPFKARHNGVSVSLMNMKLTILYVITRYLAPDRIDPSKMFLSALESAAKMTPEIMVKKNKNNIVISVVNKKMTISATIASPIYLTASFSKVFEFLKKHLPSDVKLDKIEYQMIAGMLETLDPHTNFLPPEILKEMKIHHSGAFGGLGIVVAVCGGKLSVIKTLPNTPAFRAGIKSGDHIVKIENQTTANLTLSEAVKKMRGEPATPISVVIGRKSWRKDKKMSIMRESIAYDSVKHRVLKSKDGPVGYIKIKSFQHPTGQQVKKAILSLKSNKVKGIILDLRNNGGGLLRAAIDVTNFFLDSGSIVAQVAKNRDKNLRSEQRANMNTTIYRGPLIVLINGGSASASEIVAGSLKYSGRALVLGNRSFGKGSVQDVIPYSSDAALKITIAQYLTYGDVSIQGRGISPDIDLHNVELSSKNKGRKIIYFTSGYESSTESSLKSSLKAARKARKDKPSYRVYALGATVKELPFKCRYCGVDPDDPIRRNSLDFIEDSSVNLSKLIISSFKGKQYRRKKALSRIKSVISRYGLKEEVKISKKLRKLFKINWKKGRHLKVKGDASFKTFKPQVAAGTWAKMEVSFKNLSETTVYHVRAVSKSSNPRLNFQELLFGKIKPNQTVKRKFEIKIPRGVSSRSDNVAFEFFSGTKKLKAKASGKLVVKGAKLPKINLKYRFVDTLKRDGILEVGEIGELRVIVKNDGKGSTGEAQVILKNLTGSQVEMVNTKVDISNLKPGKSKKFVFKIKSLNNIGDLYWKFKLVVKDCIFGNNIEIPWFVRRSGGVSTNRMSVKGFIKVRKNSLLYDVPWVKAQKIVGVVGKGDVFQVFHKLNGYYGLSKTGGKNPDVYINPSAAKFYKKAPLGVKKPKTHWNFTAPLLDVRVSSMQVNGDKVKVSANVTDLDGLRDLFITVSNVKKGIFGKKVFYKASNGFQTKFQLSKQIKVFKGINLISITARDRFKATYSKSIVVFSK